MLRRRGASAQERSRRYKHRYKPIHINLNLYSISLLEILLNRIRLFRARLVQLVAEVCVHGHKRGLLHRVLKHLGDGALQAQRGAAQHSTARHVRPLSSPLSNSGSAAQHPQGAAGQAAPALARPRAAGWPALRRAWAYSHRSRGAAFKKQGRGQPSLRNPSTRVDCTIFTAEAVLVSLRPPQGPAPHCTQLSAASHHQLFLRIGMTPWPRVLLLLFTGSLEN